MNLRPEEVIEIEAFCMDCQSAAQSAMKGHDTIQRGGG